jgi:endonuclease/exonuclease/phosphatase family metal-dependent hydrolase
MKRRIAGLLEPLVVCSLFFTVLPPANANDFPLKLMTLNLLFSYPTDQHPEPGEQERFQIIANFITQKEVDCVLCQEVVGGKLAKQLGLTETLNSALDLKSRLSRLGDDYTLRYRLANGIPLLFSVGNAIFCKAYIDILWTVARTLSFSSEVNIDGIDIKLRRKIMGCLLDNVPVFGKLLLFNVHLCAFCPSAQRQVQIDEALEFIEIVKAWVRWFHGEVPCVFGGDFNIRDQSSADRIGSAQGEYEMIINAGFVDAYAAIQECDFGSFVNGCCFPEDNPNTVEAGCTFAVDDNPFEKDPDETARIDYFFLQPPQAFTVGESAASVVFNGVGEPFVSDHSGLVIELK